jgi:hypothetical protein
MLLSSIFTLGGAAFEKLEYTTTTGKNTKNNNKNAPVLQCFLLSVYEIKGSFVDFKAFDSFF